MDLGLNGRYALVTGGSRGIGRSTALALADAGCAVAICARTESSLAATAEEIRARSCNEVLAVKADVSTEGGVQVVMDTIMTKWENLSILVNNVGGGGRWGPDSIEAGTDSLWLEVFEKNLMTALRFTRAALPFMKREQWGRVVTITSIYGREGGGKPWFNVAKTSETCLMKNLSMDRSLARCNITFNTVAPGAIMIPGTGWALERDSDPVAFAEEADRNLTLGRLGTPEEVAAVVLFLCSTQASLVNGAAVAVDGGQSRSF